MPPKRLGGGESRRKIQRDRWRDTVEEIGFISL
jgi:hypothetical protein